MTLSICGLLMLVLKAMDFFLTQLSYYEKFWLQDLSGRKPQLSRDDRTRFELFRNHLHLGEKAFFREHFTPGHFTGSALVANENLDQVLLTHHAKLNMWLQLGGHADGEIDLLAVAKREIQEESGIKDFYLYQPQDSELCLFDVDDHVIPENKKEMAHQHFDARYLFIADPKEVIVISDESHDLRWLSLQEARSLTQEESMLRMFDKLDFLRKNTA